MQNRIKEFRTSQNLTMQALADKTGTTASQINKLEKSERRLTADWMYRLAAALDIQPTQLFPETKPKNNTAKAQSNTSKPAAQEINEGDNHTPAIPVLNADADENWHIPSHVFSQKQKGDISPAIIRITQTDMEPDVKKGDYVVINTNDKAPTPAGIFVTADAQRGHIMQFCKSVIDPHDNTEYVQVTEVKTTTDAKGRRKIVKNKKRLPPTDIDIQGRVIAHWQWLA